DDHRIQRIVLTAFRSEAIREPEEIFLVDRAQHRRRRSLDDLVFERGDRERASAAVLLRNIRPTRRRRPIRSSFDPRVQVLDPAIEVPFVGLPCHAVHAGRSVTLDRVKRRSQRTGSIWWKSEVNLSFFLRLAACRTRSSSCDTLSRSCARRVLRWPAFPSVSTLGCTGSATDGSALFVGFSRRTPKAFIRIATMAESDFSGSCIAGYGSSPFRRGHAVSNRKPNPRPPGSRPRSFRTCQVLRPRRTGQALANIALTMSPSVILTTSASGTIKLSRLNGWPTRSPTDASSTSSRRPTHGSGPM